MQSITYASWCLSIWSQEKEIWFYFFASSCTKSSTIWYSMMEDTVKWWMRELYRITVGKHTSMGNHHKKKVLQVFPHWQIFENLIKATVDQWENRSFHFYLKPLIFYSLVLEYISLTTVVRSHSSMKE